MKFILLFFLMALSTQLVHAQVSDYVIDINDRKIYGTVQLSTPSINSSRIRFKDKDGQVRQYRTDEIKLWAKGDMIFETKVYSINDHKGFSVFMQRLTPKGGKVHLYEYYNTSGDIGYTQTFLERDQIMTEIEYGRFRKQMAAYFKDHKELSEKISNKKFKKKDILDIIEEYNAWREFLWK